MEIMWFKASAFVGSQRSEVLELLSRVELELPGDQLDDLLELDVLDVGMTLLPDLELQSLGRGLKRAVHRLLRPQKQVEKRPFLVSFQMSMVFLPGFRSSKPCQFAWVKRLRTRDSSRARCTRTGGKHAVSQYVSWQDLRVPCPFCSFLACFACFNVVLGASESQFGHRNGPFRC